MDMSKMRNRYLENDARASVTAAESGGLERSIRESIRQILRTNEREKAMSGFTDWLAGNGYVTRRVAGDRIDVLHRKEPSAYDSFRTMLGLKTGPAEFENLGSIFAAGGVPHALRAPNLTENDYALVVCGKTTARAMESIGRELHKVCKVPIGRLSLYRGSRPVFVRLPSVTA